ncbi:rRNA maturation RNase YbeY, partial [Psychrobacter sp.]|uniref:rRNA maturation RNase YbeY n=1 Tax=Psychrobacter sp. TaxID=56811 RepID=UPI0025FF938F
PYYKDLDEQLWEQKPKQLGVYLTDSIEGRDLNLEARDKNYATNILSYPSDLPAFILAEMDEIPLGELVICHEVVEQQAKEQNKAVLDHVTHLLVHGILHLLGFDHELGQVEQNEMEGFEIAILQRFAIDNPYLAK